jgi:hypothetical protein
MSFSFRAMPRLLAACSLLLGASLAVAHHGITAKIAFDDHGDTRNGAITLYTVTDGKLVPMAINVAGKTEKLAAAPAAAPVSGS